MSNAADLEDVEAAFHAAVEEFFRTLRSRASARPRRVGQRPVVVPDEVPITDTDRAAGKRALDRAGWGRGR